GSVNWTGQLFRLARRNPTPFVGDGHGSVFPIHVDDVVDMTVTAAGHPAAANQIFNCTPDPSPTWREFLGAYSRLAGHDGWLAIRPSVLTPFAALVRLVSPRVSRARDLPDLLRFTQRDITFKMTKARDLLGWQPQVDLETGVAGCAEWLREQGYPAWAI
ncbi:MAG: NAD(P)-dependent oxidoreductase, partial [Anaerolineae bacterium]|nr:NAD(P)-dependent oxidoreductase [Anaerolineae bacterium]